MQVRVRHGKNKYSEAFARFHRVVCDQPFDEGGGDTGMTPPELMLAALGCCAMHYASEYLKARHLAPAEVELCVTAEKGGRPPRLTEIGIEIDAPGLAIRAREGLLKAVRNVPPPPHAAGSAKGSHRHGDTSCGRPSGDGADASRVLKQAK